MSITQKRRNYRTTYAENPPAWNSILRWAQTFQNHGWTRNARESWQLCPDKNEESPVLLSDTWAVLLQSRGTFRVCRGLNSWYTPKQAVYVSVQPAYCSETWGPWLNCPEWLCLMVLTKYPIECLVSDSLNLFRRVCLHVADMFGKYIEKVHVSNRSAICLNDNRICIFFNNFQKNKIWAGT